MQVNTINIIESSGYKVKFSVDKLRVFLNGIGTDYQTINQIVEYVIDELYEGVSAK